METVEYSYRFSMLWNRLNGRRWAFLNLSNKLNDLDYRFNLHFDRIYGED